MADTATKDQEQPAAPATGDVDDAGQGVPLGEDPPRATTDVAPPAAKARASKKASTAAAAARPIAVRVTMHELEDFAEEVVGYEGAIDRNIMRVTVREDPPGQQYGMRRIDVIAGIAVEGQVVELIAVAGTDFGTDNETDVAARAQRDALIGELQALATSAGLEVRPGRFGAL